MLAHLKSINAFFCSTRPKFFCQPKSRRRGKNNRTPNARTSHSYFLLWVHSVRECISGPMLNVIFVALHIIGHKRIAQFFQQSTFTWNDAFRPISSTSNPNSQHYTQNHCHHQSLPGRNELPSILIVPLPPGVSIIFKIRVFYKARFEEFELFIRWPYAVFHKMQVVFYKSAHFMYLWRKNSVFAKCGLQYSKILR